MQETKKRNDDVDDDCGPRLKRRRTCAALAVMCDEGTSEKTVEEMASLAARQVLAHPSQRVERRLREAWPHLDLLSKRVLFFVVLNVGSWLREAASVSEKEERVFLDGLSVLCAQLCRRKVDKKTFLVDVGRLYRATRTTCLPSSV
jgi:hypothetical protein